MITAWLGRVNFWHIFWSPFLEAQVGQHVPKGCQNGTKKWPKSDNFRKMKTSILAAIYYTLATLTPPKALPKFIRKSEPTKVDQKDTNTHNIVPKWSQNGLPHFPGFARKWVQILMWIPKWPQEASGDPKMDPKDLTWPQNVPKWHQTDPKMVPKLTKTHPQNTVSFHYNF